MDQSQKTCWCCQASFSFDGSSKNVQGSPFGGAWSDYKCDECIAHRALTPRLAIWRLVDYGIDEGVIKWLPLNRFYRADGCEEDDEWDATGPVEVWIDGKYVLLRDWLGTQAQITELAEYRAEKPHHFAA